MIPYLRINCALRSISQGKRLSGKKIIRSIRKPNVLMRKHRD